MLTKELEKTLHRALSLSADRKHEYATVEHLLLSLIDDADARMALDACGLDVNKLRNELTEFLDNDLAGLSTEREGDPKPTAGFQRIVQRAAIHVQSAGRDDVNGANVLVALFSERESHAVYFLQQLDITRLDVVNFISHGVSKSRQKIQTPPALPPQGIGPHVEIDPNGVISFPAAESLDQHGNHLSKLKALHPELRELARELFEGLGRGNVPHSALKDRALAYLKLIDQELVEIDFRRLYTAGVRLSNAAYATELYITKGELPDLGVDDYERLSSLLSLHGPFILATAAGAEAIMDEERYQRRPEEEELYRQDALRIAKELTNRPDLLSPNVAEEMVGAADEIGTGVNPERSSVVGTAIVRNVLIALAAAAIAGTALHDAGIAGYFGTMTANETIKNTKAFQIFTKSMAEYIDIALENQSSELMKKLVGRLKKHCQFVTSHETSIRRLAGDRKELSFINRTLDWLKDQNDP